MFLNYLHSVMRTFFYFDRGLIYDLPYTDKVPYIVEDIFFLVEYIGDFIAPEHFQRWSGYDYFVLG